MSALERDSIELTGKFVMQSYARQPLQVQKAKGALVWGADGKKFVDMCAGIGVSSVGHCNPLVVQAIKKQASQLLHCSNLYYSMPQALLAQKLAKASGLSKAFFCNSGAESVEAAIKLAKKHSGKKKILAFKGSFHGRTTGALSATWKKQYRKAFEPLMPCVEFAEFGELCSAEEKIDENTAAVIVEPIQGEGGVIVPPKTFLPGLKKLCEEKGALLVFDEVQTGLCRTGKMFAFEHFKTTPDILCLSKALGGGLPIGAMLASKKVSNSFEPGDHASTFGGNPVACAAGLAALEVMQKEKLAQRAQALGKMALAALEEIVSCGKAVDARGMGLMLGLELESKEKCALAIFNALAEGALFCKAGEKTVRLLPPLVISQKQLNFGLALLKRSV